MFRIRFSLKRFLLATTLIAALVGTFGKRAYDEWTRRNWLAEQQRVSQELSSAGCGIELRDGRVVQAQITPAVTGSHALFRLNNATDLERLSVTCFVEDRDVAWLKNHKRLRQLHFFDSNFSNDAMTVFGDLSQLEDLSLVGLGVTDDGLIHLRNLNRLVGLDLWKAPVQGRGLAHLAKFPNLQHLSVGGSDVTDDGIAALQGCDALVDLELGNTKVSGSGLAALRDLASLRKVSLVGNKMTSGSGLAELDQVSDLNLSEARIGPGVLKRLAEMEGLRRLDLSHCLIDDAMLAELADVRQIKWLNLYGTKITDAGLIHLQNHTKLVHLTVRQTAVSEAAVRELAKALPATDIAYGKIGKYGEVRADSALQFQALQR